MDCPFCNQAMKKGYIQSSHIITWAPKKARFFLPILSSDTVILADSFFTFTTAEAYCCENCKRIIVDYNTEP